MYFWLFKRCALVSPVSYRADKAVQQLAVRNLNRYTPNGQPSQVGQRQYVWDALGRLSQVKQNDLPIAQYQYNHRGERITKTTNGQTNNQTTSYLYEAGQLSAELNKDGQITRQYLYLADQPIAVIDTPDGKLLLKEKLSAPESIGLDAKNIIKYWVEALTSNKNSSSEQITYLHTNHLGAPEAATNQDGQVIWQASYAPFGAAQIVKASLSDKATSNSQSSFSLNIRLPGQYLDAETGLHYNRQRYYDPARGQYLTPDPLGTPDGPNPYSYVRYNPLKYVDPDGLILFAFDGTGNTNNEGDLTELGNGLSNVWQLRQLYNDGNARYITGVGTRHRETDARFGRDIALYGGNVSTVDMADNSSGPLRIDRMIAYFNDEAEQFTEDSKLMDIDIVGFSRGAAQARDFANRINAQTRNGQYSYFVTDKDTGAKKQRCQMINFRFLGLWDTVLSTNGSGRSYNLNIVPGFQYVAQAVALNEYRGDTFRRLPGSTGAFPLESITRGTVPIGQERIERGFIGAHADIGGGFQGQTNAIPLVTLNWMVEQARNIGVKMRDQTTDISVDPVIHDKSDNQYCVRGPGCDEDRTVNGGAGGTQRRMTGTGMTFGDTGQFITYYPPQILRGNLARSPRADASTGTVNMTEYLKWLRRNGYELGNLQVR